MTFPASVKQQCDDLARLLGLACSPYLWETFEPSLVAEDQPGRLSAYSIDTVCKIDEVLATHAVEQAARTRNEALVDVERDASVFAIPLVGNGLERWFAVGGMDEPASDSGRRLLRVAGEAVRRQYVIQAQSQALSDAENASERLQRANLVEAAERGASHAQKNRRLAVPASDGVASRLDRRGSDRNFRLLGSRSRKARTRTPDHRHLQMDARLHSWTFATHTKASPWGLCSAP